MDFIEIGGLAGLGPKTLGKSQVNIGRDPGNDLVIASDSTVSRWHARMSLDGAHWRIKDLGSRNGTYVNGHRVRGSQIVLPGDSIRVGKTELRVSASPESTAAAEVTVLPDEPFSDGLTPREAQILKMVAEGLTDQQIADALVVSPRTVHSHLERIRTKVGLRRRSELTRYAITQGIVTD